MIVQLCITFSLKPETAATDIPKTATKYYFLRDERAPLIFQGHCKYSFMKRTDRKSVV